MGHRLTILFLPQLITNSTEDVVLQKFYKLLIASFAIAVLSGCTHFVHSEKWTARPTQKIEQISIIWVSNASGDWDGASSSRTLGATSFSGAGIPPVANEVDYGKIGDHFKSQGTALLKLQGFSGRVEATDSQKEMLKIIQTSNSEKYWLVFEAQKINVITNYTGTHVGVLIGASLKDARTGKEIWSGSYGLVAIKNPITGRKFAAPQVKEMLTSALKSISS